MPKNTTAKGVAANQPYQLRISRLTVDKSGVKLYDKASAVVAEIIANSYDADAEKVTVRLPLSTQLATRNSDGSVQDHSYCIEVIDDGHGMTPDEAIRFYLEVGRDRRQDEQGRYSREKHRPVMGRKGIGKLAPFGICKVIEVVSAGGPKTKNGYLVAHFQMDYDRILSPSDEPVDLVAGELDRTYLPKRGTTIRLKSFAPKRVPDEETFHRQLATRFVFARPDFEIIVEDTRDPAAHLPKPISPVSIAIVENTKIDLSKRPVTTEAGTRLPVSGWLAMAKDPYKNEETAGVRIYARNKIVATTRDFEQPAGFTGEFTIRSYLVGEVVAEWLDVDDGEDLVRSDRQGILWDSDYGRALRKWGSELIKEIGKLSKEPRRTRVRDIFLRKSKIEQKAKERFADKEVVDVAVDLAKQIGSFADEGELEDEEYVSDLTEIILSVAPHKALIEAFQEFSAEVTGGKKLSLNNMLDLFGKARIAEMASYSQIAAERVRALRELEGIVHSDSDESQLQRLIARAPWLVDQQWVVISKNQALKTFKSSFEAFYKKRTGKEVVFAIDFETKRPDFTLVSLGHKLHIVEIKAPKHALDDKDIERLLNYLDAFDAFFEEHAWVKSEFPQSYQVDLIVDAVSPKVSANRRSLKDARDKNTVFVVNWNDFLAKAIKAHEQFLDINDKASSLRKSLKR